MEILAQRKFIVESLPGRFRKPGCRNLVIWGLHVASEQVYYRWSSAASLGLAYKRSDHNLQDVTGLYKQPQAQPKDNAINAVLLQNLLGNCCINLTNP